MFDSSEHLESCLNESIYGTELFYKPGEPLKRYQEWIKASHPANIMEVSLDMLTFQTHSYDSKSEILTPKASFSNDLWEKFESMSFNDFVSFYEDSEERYVGIIVRPFQHAREWFRDNDAIDYYSEKSMASSWENVRREFYPYSSGRLVNRVTGEASGLSLSELNSLPEELLNRLEPNWNEFYPAAPKEVMNMLESFGILKKELTLIPTIAKWWS